MLRTDLTQLSLPLVLLFAMVPWTAPQAAERATPLRFRVRLQMLSGLSLSLVSDENGENRLAAFVPLDLELATRVDGVLSLAAAVRTDLAPFSLPNCPAGPTLRPHAAASLVGARLDLRNHRDGSWWSPWVALRLGVGGQQVAGEHCATTIQLFPAFSPRLGADLWMGKAAATFALGYDHLPTGSLVSLQVGLTLRLD